MKINKIDTIIFDVGGVFHKNPVEEIKDDLVNKFELSSEVVDKAWKDLAPSQLGRGKITEKEFWDKFKAKTNYKESIPEDLLYQLIDDHNVFIFKTIKIVEKLKESGYKLGIVSDNIKPFVDYLKSKGVFDSFDVTIFSCDVGYRKPEPDIFKLALEKLNSRPEESVFVDDVEDYVDAARGLGMEGIVFKDPDQLANALFELGIEFSLYEYVEETIVGAFAILIGDDGELVLQQRDNKPEIINPGAISMFGGTLNKDEDPLEGLQREIDEELGVDVNNYEVEELSIFYKSREIDGIDYTIQVYVIRGVNIAELVVTEGQAVKKPYEYFLNSQKLTRITRLALEEYSRKK